MAMQLSGEGAIVKGIIFNLFEAVVTAEYGQDAWEDVLDATGYDGAYTAVGSYDDDEFLQLAKVAAERVDVPLDDLVRWFGRSCLPILADRYPDFFTPHSHTKPFLLTLNDVIHPEVRKLFPGAYAPSFSFEEPGPDSVALSYHSHRGLCSFAEGLIEGAADHYNDKVTIEQRECTKRGDPNCVLVASFPA